MPHLVPETASPCAVLSLYRKSKRWIRLCHDAEAGEGRGYYYIDGSTHSQSLGWGGSEAHAKAAFTRALRQDPVDLTHVAGWRVPPLHVIGAPMTTAQFARAFAPGQRWWRRHYDGPRELLIVKQVRSADLVFEGPRYLDFPKASRLRRIGEKGIAILDAEGKRQLTYMPETAS